VSAVTLPRLCVRGGDGELAAIRHGVARIDGEIEQRAFQLIGVAERSPQIVRSCDFKIDALADGPAQQILQRHHELVDIDAFRDQRLPPRKGSRRWVSAAARFADVIAALI